VVAYVVTQAQKETDDYSSNIWLAPKDGEPIQFTQGKKDSTPRWSPDGSSLGFLRPDEKDKAQVWVMPIDGGEPHKITSAKKGVAEFAWDPSGERIVCTATVLADDSEEEDDSKPLEINRALFKADGRGHLGKKRRHLFVVDLDGGEAKALTSGDFDVTWPTISPDGSQVAFTTARHEDRDVDYVSHVFLIGIEGGELTQLTDWNGSASVPDWKRDGSSIVFAGKASPRSDRHARLFEVSSEGGEPRELAPSFDRNVMIGGPGYPGAPPRFYNDGSAVLFCARDRGCTHVFRVEAGGDPEKVVGDEETVISGVDLGEDGTMVYAAAGPIEPGDIYERTEAGAVKKVTSLNTELFDELDIPTPERRTFEAPDGTQIEGWFLAGDGNQRPQPLLLDVHGGPHNAFSPVFASTSLYRFALAAKGWSVLFVNSRGSDGYGEDFYGSLTGGWGRNDMNDYLSAINALIAEGAVDPDRIAVTGYSYGGYMTNWLMAQTDRFAAGVTGGCVTNLISQYGTSDFGAFLHWEIGGEAYEAKDIYWELSALAHVEKVTAPVLILHGQRDDRCPVGQAEEWFTSLKRQRKVVEMVLYPGESHLFILNGKPSHRIDYAKRIVDWVTKHAGPKPDGKKS
jgi:dipeptidyl aminopeptidase/acylaminoacyl peptidase